MHLITYADGSTNLQRALASRGGTAATPAGPGPAASAKPAEPVRANVTYTVEDVAWDSPGAETVHLTGTTGKLQLDTSGNPLIFDLLTQVVTGSRNPTPARSPTRLSAAEMSSAGGVALTVSPPLAVAFLACAATSMGRAPTSVGHHMRPCLSPITCDVRLRAT